MNNIKEIEIILKNAIKGTIWQDIVYIAGGYVRDELMGLTPKDIDLLIDIPNGGTKFASWIVDEIHLGKDLCLFPRFGTAKFSINGCDIEAVMPRIEVYFEGSRKPDVVNGTLKEDAFRRDLTINSLFKKISTGEYFDFTGRGLDDIKNKVLTTPLDPDITFADDSLRILRVIRFKSKLPDFIIDNKVYYSLYMNRIGLRNISKERIRDELDKILISSIPDICLRMMSELELLNQIIPELSKCKGVEQNQYHKNDVFEHILEVVRNTQPILNQRLMALLHDIAKPICKTCDNTGIHFLRHEDLSSEMAEDILRDLKYPLDIIDSVKLGIQNHMIFKHSGQCAENISDKSLRKFIFRVGKDLDDVLSVIHADNISHASEYCLPFQISYIKTKIFNFKLVTKKPLLPINGDDLIEIFNLKPGKIFKELLGIVEEKYYENPQITKEEALQIIKDKLEGNI